MLGTPAITIHIEEATETLKKANGNLTQRIDELRKGGHLPPVLKFFYHVQAIYEQLDETRKAIYAQLEGMSRNVIPEMMSEQGIKTISLEDIGYRFTVNARLSASIADKAKGYDWLREHGHGDLIQETVNSSSLSAFAKSFIAEKGQDLPPEIFKVSTMRFTSCTKI